MAHRLSKLCTCLAVCSKCCLGHQRRSGRLLPTRKCRGRRHVVKNGRFSDEDEEEEDNVDERSEDCEAFDSPLFGGRTTPGRYDRDSSLERMDEHRRGSLPLVSTYTDSLESVSATSRLASFFSKKGFKSNLKRTKSATKLDRKQSSPNLSDRETSLISARMRSSRSHESLLASPASMHSIDLSAPDVQVKPLHSSVLGQGHCFHVATSQGSKYISCTTSEERDKWLSSLRRTIRPQEEHSRRSDSSLKLWILEAKNVTSKRRYFCDILLDRTLYAQTSMKMMSDMLFWGEHFDFKNLPAVDVITVNLYREADKKKKKDKNTLIGYINLFLADFENRQLVEKWITCNSGTVGKAGKETKSDLPIIRLKARRQTVDILPLDAYQSFIKYLSSNYKPLCQMLEPLLTIREKDDFATALVHILQKQGKACEFLSDIVMEEISQLDDEHLTFRGNSIATKAMEAYMKLVGEKYLQDTLGEFIRQLVQSSEDCEVDPTKVATPQLLLCQQKNLDMYSNMAWVKVINSFCYFPNELREVFASFRNRCTDKGKADYSDNLISGCIFLRFLCPAILYPSLFNITQEYPSEKASRNLTLIAKTIQTLANFTQFGGKEEFMIFMNSFIEREAPSMKSFLLKISSRDAGNQFLEFDGCIDLGKELSVLHALLVECLEKYSETLGPQFDSVAKILSSISKAFDDPTVGQKKPNRKSQIYDNLVPSSTPTREQPQSANNRINNSSTRSKNLTASSPTELLIDCLHQVGESTDDIPALANRGKSSDVARDVSTTSSSSQSKLSSSTGSRVKTGQEVAGISAAGQRQSYRQRATNESWIRRGSAPTEKAPGEFQDLIPFMDEDAHNTSLEVETNKTGSQVSININQESVQLSSSYQSLTQNVQSSPPPTLSSSHPDSCTPPQLNQELTRELTRSPVIHFQPPAQPLAFSNPLFQHHHQPPSRQQTGFRTGISRTHPSVSVSQAETIQRVSSDSSLSSDGGNDPSAKQPKSSDYESSIAPLKKLSQLSSSSSDDSLAEQSTSSVSTCSHSSYSSHYVQTGSSTTYNSPSATSRVSSSVMSLMGNSAMSGCSTFPRRHRIQQEATNGKDAAVDQPQTPREIISGAESSKSLSHRTSNFNRQISNPTPGNSGNNLPGTPSQQPPRIFPKRIGITTNQSGHLQQRSLHGASSFSAFTSSDVDFMSQLPTHPASRGYNSSGSSAASSAFSSPASQHRADRNSLLGSPANFRTSSSGSSANTPTSVATPTSLNSHKGVTHKPPAASSVSSSGWQIAHHVERSSSSQETSSSSDSSPQSLVRSNQHSTSSMHESSSAHSISSAHSPSQPWGYTPSHSDSNSSVSSLTKFNPRAPVRSDSSGSLGGGNMSRTSQTPSDSNSSVSSGNNNHSSALASSGQLDNRGLFHNHHTNPAAFNARLSSVSDSQINTISLQPIPFPQPPAFLSSKYAVVHPRPANGTGSPRIERISSYHSNPESMKSGLNISHSYTASRSMDLAYLSKQGEEALKRACTDSTLNQTDDRLSPIGSDSHWSLSGDDNNQSSSLTSNSSSNRRLSPQSTVHMGISSVQRKLLEQERTKQEYEQEVHVLRQQLLEAQERLQQAELRLLDHEMDTHKLMDEWQYRLVESEEKMRRQQAEKDEQMKSIMSRLQSIEEELKKEQAEMASTVEHKQQVIEVQEHRIRKLDEANNKLLLALSDLKGRAARNVSDENSNAPTCNGILGAKEIVGFKTSSC